jgi:hypothetical protein
MVDQPEAIQKRIRGEFLQADFWPAKSLSWIIISELPVNCEAITKMQGMASSPGSRTRGQTASQLAVFGLQTLC